MSGSKPRALTLLVVAVSLLGSAALRADEPTLAEKWFAQGRQAMTTEDYSLARAHFEASYRADPAPGALLNLAVCEEKLGLWSAAVTHLEQALQQVAAEDRRRPSIIARLEELRPRISNLTVAAPTPAPPPPTAKPRAPDAAPPSRSPLALWAGGVGLASLALGIAAGAEVLHFKSSMAQHCDATGCDPAGMAAAASGRTWSWVSTIATGAGVMGLGTSLYLSLTPPSSQGTSAEVVVRGRF